MPLRCKVKEEEDKIGNGWSDHFAAKGINEHCIVALTLASWCGRRQQRYEDFMKRAQCMIVAVIMQEKEERDKRERIAKMGTGHDDETVMIFGTLPSPPVQKSTSQVLQLTPLTRGVHEATGLVRKCACLLEHHGVDRRLAAHAAQVRDHLA